MKSAGVSSAILAAVSRTSSVSLLSGEAMVYCTLYALGTASRSARRAFVAKSSPVASSPSEARLTSSITIHSTGTPSEAAMDSRSACFTSSELGSASLGAESVSSPYVATGLFCQLRTKEVARSPLTSSSTS